ncbi:MAG: hypothetical protein GF418_09365 [Chitinivibrionales bacterium]|nr:hypothetical protein [Chitinivibrionales bacterium]MBD3395817.1 hypothetical protein [Chitinivibrionales bacterium]
MRFNIHDVPFSRHGSYTAISYDRQHGADRNTLYWRCVHGDALWRSNRIFRIEVLKNGRPAVFTPIATPSHLRLKTPHGSVEFVMPDNNLVRVRGTGVSLRLTCGKEMEPLAQPARQGQWEINATRRRVKYMLTPLRGAVHVDAPWLLTDYFHHRCPHVTITLSAGSGERFFESAIEEFESEWEKRSYRKSFSRCIYGVDKEFSAWKKKLPKVPAGHAKTAELAAYVMWSAVVAPSGTLKRPAMLMSKNWMIQVWAWDNCFNAWALAFRNPAAAWDQFMINFDRQHAQGSLADSVSDRAESLSFVKPPVHGWVLAKLLAANRSLAGTSRLREIYGPLCRWTEWWLTYRDTNGDGLPEYKHGNDSGWDNCTLFEAGTPVEGPDLSAYLVLQMETLATVAGKLGRKREARQWMRKSKTLQKRLIRFLWNGERFVAPRLPDCHCVESDSLLAYLPIVLGKRLPPEIRTKLVAGLKRRGLFLTRWGLATESPESPRYIPDGYWRGPIWAPSTLVIVDGLWSCGEHALARTIARRFLKLVAKSGMAENFDAVTGRGLRDPAYTWTPSVFFILARHYAR